MSHGETVSDRVTINGRVYIPHIVSRNGRAHFTRRWFVLVRPTVIAFSLALHFDRHQLPTLALLLDYMETPKQLRKGR